MSAKSVSGARDPQVSPVGATSSGALPKRALLWLLGCAGLAILAVAILVWRMVSPEDRGAVGELTLLLATTAAAGSSVLLGLRPGAGMRVRAWGAGLAIAAILQAVVGLVGGPNFASRDSDALTAAIGVLLVLSIAGALLDLAGHIKQGRAEIASDAALVAAFVGGMAYLLLAAGGKPASHFESLLTAGVALAAVLTVAGWWVLALWVPSREHAALAGCATLLAAAGIGVAFARTRMSPTTAPLAPAVLASVAVIGLAALFIAQPGRARARSRPLLDSWWVRPSLLTVTLGGACVTLGIALVKAQGRGGGLESGALLALLAVLVGVRSFISQGTVTRTSTELARVLAERESALQSVQAAVDGVAASEARLRLLLDAAVDGVVELDANATVLTANGAFCTMVRLPVGEVVGQRWADVAARAPGAGESLAELPSLGEAELTEEGRTTYLEARSSTLSGNPPGTLLLIRDVTANKVAEQTIRTLFQFLQDRDEDRSRLLRQANQTIEAERNRIARDLHDGPIQGISAATLSLEAVKMMVDAGDVVGAADLLGKIRTEISEEGENLRRLMSNLRPPVLEERGLIPAVRELCDRFQKDTAIRVEVQASGEVGVPDEIEILAYRVVQEALSNIMKHAGAGQVTVRVAGLAGALEVEISDDGHGFDPSLVREFLRRGKVGLASMRERTELGAGTFTVRSSPGRGTIVTASLPYDLLPPTPEPP